MATETRRSRSIWTTTGVLHIRMDRADARSPLTWSDDGQIWHWTPLRTADARHDWPTARRLVLAWIRRY